MQDHEKDARVLIVDDEPLVRRSIEKTLLRAGFEVETAANCADGLTVFETAQENGKPFDLAVLDINMPDFSGIEAAGAGLQLLQKLIVHRPDLPVVMLTAYDEVKKAKESINIGARAYFVKGREQGLLSLINDLMKTNT